MIPESFTDYEREVQAEADRMVRDGECAPWDAYPVAHRRVQERRRRKAQERGIADVERLLRESR